ncbi:doublecortin domain-containing protein 2 isoform X2 [Sarcophilus harrisii]|uniref:doublecortin domain-containing protein 2 isoform X2 n=1 Tax=Sarcophilus harrisii TaxID=9305 RepID=UPI0013019D99|nr:doublecortin domain-containing protein 2 isoform X2 [Sarcophilus harrisii]
MSSTSTRSNCLTQPVVKSVLVYRNGDPFFAGRRVVIHEKKVSSFDVFLKEVTGGVQAPFGAVRNIYTPRAGHRIRKLDQIQSGGNYVAGGLEAFKKLNYLDIGEPKKRSMEVVNSEVKPVIHSRINVSARFKKPLQEPCTIFLIANGDLISPASRLFIPRKALSQWDLVLEMVTEKITLRSGAVHRLYTLEGKLVQSGSELENGQFYVAVGRDKFKRLPYSDLLFDKSTMRRPYGQKTSSLPPIVGSRKSKGSVNDRQSKSTIGSSDNSSPLPSKRRGKKEEVLNSEKTGKVKRSTNPKTPPTVLMPPNNDKKTDLSSRITWLKRNEGIFKAGTERSEMEGAAEVQEDEDTQVEIPVDQRPAEIIYEEEGGGKENEDIEEEKEEEKENLSEINGDPEDKEAEASPKQRNVDPPRVNGGTNEENGEELDEVNNDEHQEQNEEITLAKGDGDGDGPKEVLSYLHIRNKVSHKIQILRKSREKTKKVYNSVYKNLFPTALFI